MAFTMFPQDERKMKMKMTTVRDLLNIVYDEQWVRLDFEDESHDSHIDVWGADWIGGYEGT